jgi:hypothetical protein
MRFIKLTKHNVFQHVGNLILFKTRNQYTIKKMDGISPTGKTIYIQHHDLNNSLQIVTRNVYAIIPPECSSASLEKNVLSYIENQIK